MSLEKENILEENLILKLQELGYEYIKINNESDLISNFKIQIEKLNNIELTDKEFNSLYINFNHGDNFERASRIRNDSFSLERNGTKIYLKFFKNDKWCENIYQVSNQIRFENQKANTFNRYDVTILINGIPMIQIELKRKGNDLKEAFNQINRYKKESFNNLFKFIQIFIISNGSETKYFSTNEDSEDNSNYKFAFFWSNENNERINSLLNKEENKNSFVESFLPKCKIGKMISKYIIIGKENRDIKILRPYQYFAIEKSIDLIKKTNKSGYIWHTTGSGKTLTSFKLAQEIKNNVQKIEKVFFVVDRKDLNSQTFEEFTKFDSDEDILDTKNTYSLINSIKSNKNELVITTIQKFGRALNKINEMSNINEYRNKKVLFIFDECHRSQFGEVHKLIRNFFINIQMIGFTGTPINVANSTNHQTTRELFGELIHSYTISEAISDGNVLGFVVQYLKTYDLKNKIEKLDKEEEVPSINTKEVWENEKRIEKIVQNIFEIHKDQTLNKRYNALFTVSNINFLKKYYEEFKKQNNNRSDEEKLNIAAIYSITDNEDLEKNEIINKNSKEFLKSIASDFSKNTNNKLNLNTDDWFNPYRTKLIKAIKKNKIDIVLVVNMLITGFDSKKLNTLYVDKNLKYHNLLQAFSRTNRIDKSSKKHGHIVCYSRPTKKEVDESISEFSNKNSLSIIIKDDYLEYVKRFNQKYNELKTKFNATDKIISERDPIIKKEFVSIFKEMISEYNLLKTFNEFNFNDLSCKEQEYAEYERAYKNIYREYKESPDSKSILNEIDFEIELITRNFIDDKYISYFLNKIIPVNLEVEKYKKNLEDFKNDIKHSLYSQKLIDLITQFINKQLEKMEIIDGEVFNYLNEDKFFEIINKEKQKKLNQIIEKYNLSDKHFLKILRNYEETGKVKKKSIKELIKNQKNIKSEIDDTPWWKYEDDLSNEIINFIYQTYDTFNY